MVGDEGSAADQVPKPETSEIVMYVSAVVLLVASFVPLLEIDFAGADDDDLGFGALFGAFMETEWSVWSDAFSIFPLVTLPVLSVLVLVGLRALGRFTTMTMPDRLLGFPLPVAGAAVAAFAGVAVGAQMLRALLDSGSDDDGGSFGVGVGGWLAAVALIALVVTAVQEARSTPPVDAGRRRPDARATGVVAVGVVVMAVASALDVWSAAGEGGVTAWSEGARPVYLVPLVVAVLAAIATVVDLRADERRVVLGVDVGRWRILLAALALFAAASLLIGNPAFGGFGSLIDTGAGVYVSILGAAAVLVGTVLNPKPTNKPPDDPLTS